MTIRSLLAPAYMFLAFAGLRADQTAQEAPLLSKIMGYFAPVTPHKSSLSIGVISIDGVIDASMGIIQELLGLIHNPSVDAILLVIDSPGGSPGDSQHIAEIVSRVADKKPFVCFIPSCAASGGYYIAAAAPYIVATPESVVGSIGVVHELPKKTKNIHITAGEFKRAKYLSKGVLDPEHEKYYQDMVDETFHRFCGDIARWRKLDIDTVKGFQARIFHAHKAIDLKLIDATGTIQEAVAALYSFVRKKSEKSYSRITLFDKEGNDLITFPVESIEALIASSSI